MEEKIKNYIDSVFKEVPDNERAMNIKSEILQNLLDKYRDLIGDGKSEDEAYAIAISSGGDLSGIVADLRGENVVYNYNYEKQFERMYEKEYAREKKKCARFESLLWPLTVCVYLLYSFLVHGVWWYSWIIFVAATAASSFYKFYTFKSNQKARRAALSGFVWTSAVVIYFVFSFLTRRWEMSWIIFIIAIAASRISGILIFGDSDEADDEE